MLVGVGLSAPLAPGVIILGGQDEVIEKSALLLALLFHFQGIFLSLFLHFLPPKNFGSLTEQVISPVDGLYRFPDEPGIVDYSDFLGVKVHLLEPVGKRFHLLKRRTGLHLLVGGGGFLAAVQ